MTPSSPRLSRRFFTQSWSRAAAVVVGAVAFTGVMLSAGPQTAPATPAQAPAPAPARGRGIQPNLEHPILQIGAAAPDFALPGVDGKTHKLADYASAKVLAIVFECNHCPVSQLYESRVKKLYDDYRAKGVTLVAINPNNPKSIRLNELGYTDVTDSLAEMKIRTAHRHIAWPYLYDGETQAVSIKFGVVATPHIYLFDQARKLQYQGRIDDNQREDLVKSQDARNALDAMLAGKPVPVATTGAFGCTTKWMSKATGVEEEWAAILKAPVTLDTASAGDLEKLAKTGEPGKVLLLNFWSTDCASCVSQFTEFETTYRMYAGSNRAFNMVTIATNPVAQKDAVMQFLQKEHAAGPNKLASDRAAVQAAAGAAWKPGTGYTMVISPDGKVLYQKAGKVDVIAVRRIILANMPDTRSYIGQQAYWNEK